MAVIAYTDGGARGNPGPAGIGAVILRDGEVVAEIKKYIGITTNNQAEYVALISALQEILTQSLQDEYIEMRLDSELVIKQMKGEYKVKDTGMQERKREADALVSKIRNIKFTHVRREYNKHADRLVNEAIDDATVA